MRERIVVLLFVLCFAVAGCGTSPVADDLSQRDANEVVSALRDHGIDSYTEKQKGGRGRYSVVVSEGRFGESVSILNSLGLPVERKASFTELVAPSGILPSSHEVESLRLDRAAAAELEDLLKSHAGVASAGVVVRSHGLENGVNPTVSVVLQLKSGGTFPPTELRQVISRSVPGLKGDDITVSVSEQPAAASTTANLVNAGRGEKSANGLIPFLGFWRVPQDEYTGLAAVLIGLLLLVAALAGLAGYILGQYFLSRQGDDGMTLEPLDGMASMASARIGAGGPRAGEVSRSQDEEMPE